MELRTVRRFSALPPMVALVLVLLSGCTSQAALDASAGLPESDKQAARELYAGQPSVVHATEYPVASAAEGIARGDDAWRQGKLDLAVYLYVQSLAYDATAPGPFLKIGAIHERLGNRPLAERAFELALERDPGNAGACERLGLLYLGSQRAEQARALFERATRIDPDRWQSHNGLGIAADRRGDFAAAIAHYDKALVLAPGTAAVVNNRGYSRMLAGDLAGADADFRLAIALGAQAGTWVNLGKVEAKQGHYAEALECLLKETGLAQAHNMIGEVAMDAGDLAAAQKYFTLAISSSPRYFEAAEENLGLVNERLARPGALHTRIARTDASVYGTQARQAVIGVVKRGLPVSVLKTQDSRSLVSFRVGDGTQLTGWVASASLEDAVPLL
jgi:Flp pilus assembly protein TadD